MSDEIPRRLVDRQVVVPVGHERLCPGPHIDPATMSPESLDELRDWVCPWCSNTGVLPRDLGIDASQREHFGVTAIPFGHPAGAEESWVAGLGPGHQRRERRNIILAFQFLPEDPDQERE